ncbi:MAG: hypothetical protein HXY50_07550 [Ignavibacteriaceae bacterium]|nr:hypothetical protein [Ignavibacteriaceae bacterium]
MSIIKFTCLLTCFMVFSGCSASKAQVNWSLYSEGGLFSSINTLSAQPNDFLLRVDGNLGYLFTDDNISAKLQFKIRPEIYGSEENFKSLKLKANGNYFQEGEKVNWGINLAVQKNFYQNNLTHFNHSTFSVIFNTEWNEFKNYPLTAECGYSYQTASDNIEQDLDLFFFGFDINKNLFLRNNSSIGFYIEKFVIDNKYLVRIKNTASINKGWRLGPKFNFKYFDNSILYLDYRLLFHFSQVTESPSLEHLARLIAGTIFYDRWSIFLLVDYYDRRFTLKHGSKDQDFLIYNFLDIENKMNVKLGRDLGKDIEVYIKGGYFKERFFNQSFNFEGFNLLFGIEVNQ